jgi:site-specific recombinase XerD
VDVRVIQDLLGHRSIRSTQVYTQVTPEHLRAVRSPLQLLKTGTTG